MRRRAVRSATRSWVEGSGGTLEEGEDGAAAEGGGGAREEGCVGSAWVEGGGGLLEEGEDGAGAKYCAGALEEGGRTAAARWRTMRTAPEVIREERVRVGW